MRWMVVGLILVALCGRVGAQETPVETEELERQEANAAYEQAIRMFNSHIKAFPSWEAFKTEVLSRISSGTPGRCYAPTGKIMQPVKSTSVTFSPPPDQGWHRTSGHGWRRRQHNPDFVEYRINEHAKVLLRLESDRSLLFFASAKRICEFPLHPPPERGEAKPVGRLGLPPVLPPLTQHQARPQTLGRGGRRGSASPQPAESQFVEQRLHFGLDGTPVTQRVEVTAYRRIEGNRGQLPGQKRRLASGVQLLP